MHYCQEAAHLWGPRHKGVVEGAKGVLAYWREATVTIRVVTFAERPVSRPSMWETCAYRITASKPPGGGATMWPRPAMGQEAGGPHVLAH